MRSFKFYPTHFVQVNQNLCHIHCVKVYCSNFWFSTKLFLSRQMFPRINCVSYWVYKYSYIINIESFNSNNWLFTTLCTGYLNYKTLISTLYTVCLYKRTTLHDVCVCHGFNYTALVPIPFSEQILLTYSI